MTAGTGQPGKDCQTGLLGRDSQNGTARKKLPDRAART